MYNTALHRQRSESTIWSSMIPDASVKQRLAAMIAWHEWFIGIAGQSEGVCRSSRATKAISYGIVLECCLMEKLCHITTLLISFFPAASFAELTPD